MATKTWVQKYWITSSSGHSFTRDSLITSNMLQKITINRCSLNFDWSYDKNTCCLMYCIASRGLWNSVETLTLRVIYFCVYSMIADICIPLLTLLLLLLQHLVQNILLGSGKPVTVWQHISLLSWHSHSQGTLEPWNAWMTDLAVETARPTPRLTMAPGFRLLSPPCWLATGLKWSLTSWWLWELSRTAKDEALRSEWLQSLAVPTLPSTLSPAF